MMKLETCGNLVVPPASHCHLNDDGLKAKSCGLAYDAILTTREIISTTKVNFAQAGNRRLNNLTATNTNFSRLCLLDDYLLMNTRTFSSFLLTYYPLSLYHLCPSPQVHSTSIVIPSSFSPMLWIVVNADYSGYMWPLLTFSTEIYTSSRSRAEKIIPIPL